MPDRARRVPSRQWRRTARRAGLALGLWLTAAGLASACGVTITAAAYDGPTARYPHGALGDDIEWTALTARLRPDPGCGPATALRATLPPELVFEDTAPRLADLDGDGRPELLTVESHQQKGARLAVWGLRDASLSRIATTPYIGTRFRWLAPVGAADLDGDGHVEIAYIDRPHLAKTLRIWRFRDGRLTEVASLPGLTNHRFGDPEIHGGIRSCGDGPEIVLADAGWSRALAVRLVSGRIETRDLGAIAQPSDLTARRACP